MTAAWTDNDTTRRIRPPEPVEFFVLREWDGGNGTSNTSSGYLTKARSVADDWSKTAPGRDYTRIRGVMIARLDDMPMAEEALKRQKALAKLTDEEKNLLGL